MRAYSTHAGWVKGHPEEGLGTPNVGLRSSPWALSVRRPALFYAVGTSWYWIAHSRMKRIRSGVTR
jgi:hypothetical protein